MFTFASLMRTLPTHMSAKTPKTNPKAEPWLQIGKERFALHGISGINVDEMSRTIGIAKTSFYYLFTNKEQFLIELFEYWEYKSTKKVTEITDLLTDPLAKLQALTKIFFDNIENDLFLLQLFNYTQINAEAHSVLNDINCNRKNYLTHLFRSLNYSEEEVEHKTRLYMTYYLGICTQIQFKSLTEVDQSIILSDIQEILQIKFK